ncbi:response regulator [Turneriella parva]|uniref:Two component transcriptional regulator, LuxR family n=1 Tax=Turneriella parva (strain ATCC BAA-1111 / DSM 21527 / NCTC 11395 / H) TaxID=869212 RepID=I4BB30_TURPD|nr:response regulator transcription factor [Turneriella parva]AFM14487.1 two component transcriptional regulator, LuxR family [Turneriella parva DSM 21527]
MSTTAAPKDYQIILADDHSILRAGVKVLIEGKPGFKVVGEVGNGQDLLDLLAKIPCDMVVLDLNMPLMNGIEALEYMQMHFPRVAVLVLTTHKEKPFLKRALAKGAKGYLLKEETHDKLISAISDIRQGKRVISAEMTSLIVDDYSTDLSSPLTADLLTQREKEILSLTANGLTSKEIAERLDISARTVEAHRGNVREKLGITTMSELVKYAMDHNLL